MKTVNSTIRQAIAETGVRQWQIADRLGMEETKFCKLLRHELSEVLRDQVLAAIAAIVAERDADV